MLVAEATDPDWVPFMKRAAGIVTDHGGATSHAAIVSRELGLPAVVGTQDATGLLRDGQMVTLSCAEGDAGRVYDGALPFAATDIDLGSLPEDAHRDDAEPRQPRCRFPLVAAAGAGRRAGADGVHRQQPHQGAPDGAAAIRPGAGPRGAAADRGADARLPRQGAYFVDTLARGVARIAAAFHPRPVILRLSDFKSNEYAHLIGGTAFEPVEENPMLGLRGASRYYSERYRDGFALECRAIRKAREEMGLDNIIVMVPFCRTLRGGGPGAGR